MYYMDLRLVVKESTRREENPRHHICKARFARVPLVFLQMTIYSLAQRNGNRSWTSYLCIGKHRVSKLIWRKTIFFFFFCVGKLHDNLLKRIINLNLKILVVPKEIRKI